MEGKNMTGYYKTIKEYTKEEPIYDKNGNQAGVKTVIVGKDVTWVCTDERQEKREQALKEIQEIEQWFNEYDNQVKQYNRAMRLGVEYDGKLGSIEELDAQATEKAKRLAVLRGLVN